LIAGKNCGGAMRVSILVAFAENGVIGREGQLPWRLPADLRRFKNLTMGHTIVMGRRTWESIGRKLPGRRMIVVSRQAAYVAGAGGVSTAANLDAALHDAERSGENETFVIGGAELYQAAFSRADRLYVTRVHGSVMGDTRFPMAELDRWERIESEYHAADAANVFPFSFEVYERK
jgi:dihydrofolate reductase